MRALLISWLLLLCIAPLSAEWAWEGSAVEAAAGEFPEEGAYIATNAVARNSVVEITNLDTGSTTRAIVTRRLSRSGLLARLSREAASDLGISRDEAARVLITTVSTPGLSTGDPREGALSRDPDVNPGARVRPIAPIAEDSDEPEIADTEGLVDEPEPADEPVTPDEPAPVRRSEAPDAGIASRPSPSRAAQTTTEPPEPPEPELTPDLEEQLAAEQPDMPTPEELDPEVPRDENGQPENRLERAIERSLARRPQPRYFARRYRTEEVEEPADPEEPSIADHELPRMTDPRVPTEAEPVEPREERRPSVEPTGPAEPTERAEATDPAEPAEDREPPTREPRRVLDDLFDDDPVAQDLEVGKPPDDIPLVDTLSSGSYYLQISAYRSRSSVAQLVDSLDERYPMAVTSSGEDDNRLYRVFVGPLSRDERGAVLFEMRGLGYRDAFVRRGGQS